MNMDDLKNKGKEAVDAFGGAVGNFFKKDPVTESSKAGEVLKKGANSVTALTSSIKTSIAAAMEKELSEFDFCQMDMSSLTFYSETNNVGTIIFEPTNIFHSPIAIMRGNGNKNIGIPNLYLTSGAYGVLSFDDVVDLQTCFEFEPSIETLDQSIGREF